jgi:hypothetical protein
VTLTCLKCGWAGTLQSCLPYYQGWRPAWLSGDIWINIKMAACAVHHDDLYIRRELPALYNMPRSELETVLVLLCQRWPKCFVRYGARRKPLKVGIHVDIAAALGDAVTADQLKRALGAYVSNPLYLSQLTEGAHRFDLDGNAVGFVTAERAKRALEDLRSGAQRHRGRELLFGTKKV